jgi:predicted O-methyltransferase YrrM
MNDEVVRGVPAVLAAIRADSDRIGFTMASEPQTGSLLRMLAASKRGGRFLELGTGTEVGTARRPGACQCARRSRVWPASP